MQSIIDSIHSIFLREISVSLFGIILFVMPGMIVAHRRFSRLSIRNPSSLWIGAIYGILAAHIGYAFFIRYMGPRDFLWVFILVLSSLAALALPQRSDRRTEPNQNWTKGDWLLLSAVSTIILITVFIPFLRVGEHTQEGVVYRNYFSGDYLKHLSVTGALMQGKIPPPNPFMNGFQLNYYWLYYLSPCFSYRLLGNDTSLLHVQMAYNIFFIMLFVLSYATLVRRFIPSKTGRMISFTGLIGLTSYEGILILWELFSNQMPLSGFTQFNVDAFTRQRWTPLQIDTLYRSYIYTPTQLLSYCFVIAAIRMLLEHGSVRNRRQALVLGITAAGCSAYNFFIGAALVISLAGMMLLSFSRCRSDCMETIKKTGIMFLPILLIQLLFFKLNMVGEAAGSLQVKFDPLLWSWFLPLCLSNFGPVFILGISGLVVLFKMQRSDVKNGIPGVSFLLVLLICNGLLMLLLHYTAHPADISLKLGQLLNIVLSFLSGAWILSSSRHLKKWITAGALILIAAAAPTLIMEIYNSQDIDQTGVRTIFKPDDLAAMDWAREHLPPDAVIQTVPDRDGTEHHGDRVMSHIVTAFALRSTVVSDRHHALLYLPRESVTYEKRRQIIYRLYRTLDFDDAFFIMDAMGIDVVCVGEQERRCCPAGASKFSILPRLYTAGSCVLVEAKDRTDPRWKLSNDEFLTLIQGKLPPRILIPGKDGIERDTDCVVGFDGTSLQSSPTFTVSGMGAASFGFPDLPEPAEAKIKISRDDIPCTTTSQAAVVFGRVAGRLRTLITIEIQQDQTAVSSSLPLPEGTQELFFTGADLRPDQQLHFSFESDGGMP